MPESALAPDAVIALPGARAIAVAWRARGILYVTVVTKASFAFASDAPMPQVEPEEILRGKVGEGIPPGGATDVVPALASADVLFSGSAHAPPGAHVRLAIFADQRPLLDKRLLVQPGPLAGLGLGRVATPPWPEGAIAEIPDGFDWSCLQAAPTDQRTGFLRGDEWIVLEGLHPSQPRLRTRLPGARGAAKVHGLEAFGVPEGPVLDLYADTLRIDGDAQRCTVVWRRSFPIPTEAALAAVRVVAGVAVGGETFSWVEPRPARQATPEPSPAAVARLPETLTLSPDAIQEARRLMAHRFGPGPADPAVTSSQGKPEPAPSTGTTTLAPADVEALRAQTALPFHSSPWARDQRIDSSQPFEGGTPSPQPHSGPTAPAGLGSAALAWAPLEAPPPPTIVAPQPALLPGSVLEASNAALRVGAVHPSTAGVPDDAPLAAEAAGPARRIDLLWFDPKGLPRIRRHSAWRPILEGLEDQPPDPDIDDPELDIEPAAAEEQREIFEVLAKGSAADGQALLGALTAAVREDGRFVAPLLLSEGELSLPFDEIETLRALCDVTGPPGSLGVEERLRAALVAGSEFLSSAGPTSSRRAAEKLSAAIREAYAAGTHEVSAAEVEEQVVDGLLEQRCYQRRAVLGGTMLRCLLWPIPLGADAEAPVPVYLPDAITAALPMFRRFVARIVAEVHPAVDERETQRVALRAVALARVEATGQRRQAVRT